MIYLKDIKTKEIFDCFEENEDDFRDMYEEPQNLISINAWYCDGAGWNELYSKICYGTNENNFVIDKVYLNWTNNEAEYQAMLKTLLVADRNDLIFSDSQLVVNQINEKFNCNEEHLKRLQVRCREIMLKKDITIKWIPRNKNFAGIFLEKAK
jgi:ribonuclease HI